MSVLLIINGKEIKSPGCKHKFIKIGERTVEGEPYSRQENDSYLSGIYTHWYKEVSNYAVIMCEKCGKRDEEYIDSKRVFIS